ncbi:MAG: CDP-alcohol phosphatidyltransferase family protein [Betaproteobacteria bacterium]
MAGRSVRPQIWERLTSLEEDLRDRTLGRVVAAVIPRWVHPNHITSLRIVLVGVAITLFLTGQPLTAQSNVLIAAALTDTIDGMLARSRKQTSRTGAYLDHFSDWLLGGWMGILALINGLLETSIILMMVMPQILVTITDRIKVSRLRFKDTKTRLLALVMGAANFRPHTISRLQFVAVLAGFAMVLFSKAENYPALHKAGLTCLYVEACLAWLLAIDGLLGSMGASSHQSHPGGVSGTFNAS